MKVAYLFFCLSFCVGCKFFLHKRELPSYGVLSSRFYHPRGDLDSMSTVKAIEKLKPRRIDWTYCEDETILNIYKKHNLPFSLTVNPQLSDSSGYTTKKHRLLDYSGKAYSAPWKKNWKIKNPYWGCVNNPKFYELFLKKTKKLASLGAYAILVDDAIFNYRLKLEKKIGCFCEFCIEKYNLNKNRLYKGGKQLSGKEIKNILCAEELQKINKHLLNKSNFIAYENFQKQAVIDFLKKWQKELRVSFPNIVFLTNNFNGSWNDIYKVFDGGIAEIKEELVNDKDLDSLYKVADRLGKTQMFTIATENSNTHFKLLEYNIKNKRESLYPWDIMIPKKNRRYYLDLDSIKQKEKELLKRYKY